MNSKSASHPQASGRDFTREWDEIIERDWLEQAMGVEERMDLFVRTLNEIRELPCSR